MINLTDLEAKARAAIANVDARMTLQPDEVLALVRIARAAQALIKADTGMIYAGLEEALKEVEP